jgi:hypothetical protein
MTDTSVAPILLDSEIFIPIEPQPQSRTRRSPQIEQTQRIASVRSPLRSGEGFQPPPVTIPIMSPRRPQSATSPRLVVRSGVTYAEEVKPIMTTASTSASGAMVASVSIPIETGLSMVDLLYRDIVPANVIVERLNSLVLDLIGRGPDLYDDSTRGISLWRNINYAGIHYALLMIDNQQRDLVELPYVHFPILSATIKVKLHKPSKVRSVTSMASWSSSRSEITITADNLGVILIVLDILLEVDTGRISKKEAKHLIIDRIRHFQPHKVVERCDRNDFLSVASHFITRKLVRP